MLKCCRSVKYRINMAIRIEITHLGRLDPMQPIGSWELDKHGWQTLYLHISYFTLSADPESVPWMPTLH